MRRRDFLGIVGSLAVTPALAWPARGDSAAPKQKPDPLDEYFASGPLPRLQIEVDPVELRGLDNDPKTYVRAHVRERGATGEPDRVYRDVGLHLKGGFGSVRPVADKPALTLNFDKFVAGQGFHGLDKLHLNNSVQDLSYMCENLGGWVFRESGVPAPRVSAARVWLNGRDRGVYVLKEGFDRPFYKRYFGDASGDLYDGNFTDVTSAMDVHLGGGVRRAPDPSDRAAAREAADRLRERRQAAAARLRAVAEACREVDPDRRNRALERVLDVERFLTFMACETIVAHWDGYGTYRNNYRIYHDPKADRMVFLPHGMDQIFQRPEHSLYGNNSRLAIALTIDNPAGRKRYIDRVAEIRQRGAFRTEVVTAQLARIAERIEPLFAESGPAAVADHKARTEALRTRVLERCAAIDRQLADPPKPVRFDAAGVAALTRWRPVHDDDGGDAVAEPFEEEGKPRMGITCKGPGVGTASWRTSELLTPGTYAFSGRMKTEGVMAVRPVAAVLGGAGACLRLSGNRRVARYTGDHDWREVTLAFTVSEPIKEVIFICELSAGSGRAVFDPASMVLRRLGGAVEP